MDFVKLIRLYLGITVRFILLAVTHNVFNGSLLSVEYHISINTNKPINIYVTILKDFART